MLADCFLMYTYQWELALSLYMYSFQIPKTSTSESRMYTPLFIYSPNPTAMKLPITGWYIIIISFVSKPGNQQLTTTSYTASSCLYQGSAMLCPSKKKVPPKNPPTIPKPNPFHPPMDGNQLTTVRARVGGGLSNAISVSAFWGQRFC